MGRGSLLQAGRRPGSRELSVALTEEAGIGWTEMEAEPSHLGSDPGAGSTSKGMAAATSKVHSPRR